MEKSTRKIIFVVGVITVLAIAIIIGLSFYIESYPTDQANIMVSENRRKLHREPGDHFFRLGDKYSYFGLDVFYEEKIIDGTDVNTFKVFGSSGYAKDRNNVFYNGVLLTGADSETFKEKGLGIFEDKKAGYYLGEAIDISEIDSLLEFLSKGVGGDDLGDGYKKYKDRIYYHNNDGPHSASVVLLVNANPGTFEVIPNTYCEQNKENYGFDACDKFGRDGEKVFRNSYELKDADPKSFVLFAKSDAWNTYSKDKNHVFYGKAKINNADPNSFQTTNSFYSKDNQRVFAGGIEIVGADPRTFKVLGWIHGKDNEKVYYSRHEIIGADPKTFVVIDEDRNISKDAYSYYRGREKVDPKDYSRYGIK